MRLRCVSLDGGKLLSTLGPLNMTNENDKEVVQLKTSRRNNIKEPPRAGYAEGK